MVQAGVLEGPRRSKIDRAADTALDRRRLRRLEHVCAGDHVRGKDVEREIAPVVVGGQDAVVERGDVVFGAKPAHADILAFAARRAVDGDAGDVLQGIGDVAVRETTEFGRVDGIEHHRCGCA